MFLKRRIIPHNLTTVRSNICEFNWEKERNTREEHRTKRTEREIKNKKSVKNYLPGEKVIVQNVDKYGRWVKRGEISYETQGKDSYVITPDDGSQTERHHHWIRVDKAHLTTWILTMIIRAKLLMEMKMMRMIAWDIMILQLLIHQLHIQMTPCPVAQYRVRKIPQAA